MGKRRTPSYHRNRTGSRFFGLHSLLAQKEIHSHIPAWVMALLALALAAAAFLLMLNLLPPATGTVTRPTEVIVSPG